MSLHLSVERSFAPSGEQFARLGHEHLDDYLTFLAGRARPNSVLAAAFDLKVFFCFVQKEPSQITSRDVLNFIAAQRAPRTQANIVRISDGGSGLSARTVARRLSSISGLFGYLIVRGDAGVTTSPVPRGLMTRRARRNNGRAAPLVRTPKLLPRILQPQEVDALMAALRTKRDRAWSRPWSSVACDAVRCWACVWPTFWSLSARCSSPTAKADASVSFPCRAGSLTPWPATSTRNVPPTLTPTSSSSC